MLFFLCDALGMRSSPKALSFSLSKLTCPVLRCLGNLLAEETGCEAQIQDERLLAALFTVMQCYLQKQPFIVPEGLWLLNNLTGECPCVAVSRAGAAAARTWQASSSLHGEPPSGAAPCRGTEHEGLPGGVSV